MKGCNDCPVGDFKAKVRVDTTGREELMGRHGARTKMNDKGEICADFCQVNELVIGRTMSPHEGVP